MPSSQKAVRRPQPGRDTDPVKPDNIQDLAGHQISQPEFLAKLPLPDLSILFEYQLAPPRPTPGVQRGFLTSLAHRHLGRSRIQHTGYTECGVLRTVLDAVYRRRCFLPAHCSGRQHPVSALHPVTCFAYPDIRPARGCLSPAFQVRPRASDKLASSGTVVAHKNFCATSLNCPPFFLISLEFAPL